MKDGYEDVYKGTNVIPHPPGTPPEKHTQRTRKIKIMEPNKDPEHACDPDREEA